MTHMSVGYPVSVMKYTTNNTLTVGETPNYYALNGNTIYVVTREYTVNPGTITIPLTNLGDGRFSFSHVTAIKHSVGNTITTNATSWVDISRNSTKNLVLTIAGADFVDEVIEVRFVNGANNNRLPFEILNIRVTLSTTGFPV